MFKFIEQQFKKPSGLLGRFIIKHMTKMNHPVYDQLIRKLHINVHDKIFEIGYGHGIGIHKILSKNDCYVSGIDFSKLMFKKAHKLNKSYIKKGTLNLYFGDFLDYHIPPESYDKVLCLNVVYFWDTLDIPFKKIHDSLKANGVFAIFMDSPDDLKRQRLQNAEVFNQYTIDQVTQELKLSGFSHTHFTYNKGYYILAQKR